MKNKNLLIYFYKFLNKIIGIWSWFLGLFNHKRKVNENTAKSETDSDSSERKRGKIYYLIK